ncbi:hypothetical protein PSCICO_00610 [Pseudomonas cichorii]|uniref:Uncharacterized protein n=1 Tax=Pseudomonas serbiensis TaxID=3064350 RepID=A0ABT9CNC5_9PSED|nr:MULTISPECIES: hypothetical protein [Pseudomonas]MDO7926999.1 hypothetical protein [Pseudomonas sp. KFB-138]GFM84662.1 hypothetical protein PSCICO_00610 [Pseudomonas cichorii]
MKIASSDQTPLMQLHIASSVPVVATENSVSASVTPVTVQVQISKEGREKLESEKYADIDRAPLPEDVKEALKNIRKLQEKIAEKSQELMELASDKTLSDDDLKRKRDTLTIEIRSMQSALGDAMSALNNSMSSKNMSAESQGIARGLLGMK